MENIKKYVLYREVNRLATKEKEIKKATTNSQSPKIATKMVCVCVCVFMCTNDYRGYTCMYILFQVKKTTTDNLW